MTAKPIPDGYPVVTPYLIVHGAARFITYMEKVFGAKVREQLMQPDGRIGHTELCIGDGLIMLAEADASQPPSPVMLHVYVEDVDAVFARAVAQGGKVVRTPADQFYGDRSGGVIEPCGNTLWIATHVEDMTRDELQQRARATGRAG